MMIEFSAQLLKQGHYESVAIQTREKSVIHERSKIKHASSERRSKLEDSRKLMLFLQDCNEVHAYLVCCCYAHNGRTLYAIQVLMRGGGGGGGGVDYIISLFIRKLEKNFYISLPPPPPHSLPPPPSPTKHLPGIKEFVLEFNSSFYLFGICLVVK